MQPFGFSSPAECFVAFSGYVLALVVSRDFDKRGVLYTQMRVLRRAWKLYILNAFSFLLVLAISRDLFAITPGNLREITRLAAMDADPVGFVRRFLIFEDSVVFFEILRNYIFFIPLTPLFVLLFRVHRLLPLLLSLAVWLAHQMGWTPPGPFPTFNPYGWQLIFFIGCAVALIKPLSEWTFRRRGVQLTVALGLLFGSTVLKLTLFHDYPAQDVPGALKVDMQIVRVVHFCVFIWACMLVLPSSERLQQVKLIKHVVYVGQSSLECFCTANVLVFVGALLLTYAPTSVAYYWLLVGALMGGIITTAGLLKWIDQPATPAKAKLKVSELPQNGGGRDDEAGGVRGPLPRRLRGA